MDNAITDMLDLSSHVQDIEDKLHDLDERLREQDALGMEDASVALHKVLADAIAAFRHAQKAGQVPLSHDLRQRLILAQARVTGLQSAVNRASATLQRTLGVLLTTDSPDGGATYSAPSASAGSAFALGAYRNS